MKIKLSPVGTKLLVIPIIDKENFKTESGLEVVDTILTTGEIVEVGSELLGVYMIGDRILFSKNSGISQMYNHKPHIWLDGRGAPLGDIWAVISEDQKESSE